MAVSENAKIQIETGQSLVAFTSLTNSGDNRTYTATDLLWSGKAGFAPDVRPNGIVSGINLLTPAASLANNQVDVAAFTAFSIGILRTVASTPNQAITRPATNVSKINSITMTSAGAIAVVVGTDGASTAFSEVRGAAGGPPFIPVDSVEIGQVRLVTSAAAVIAATEIFQVVGTHVERFDSPSFAQNNIGLGIAAPSSAEKNAHVKFDSSLPLIHTGSVTKRVYNQYFVPTLSDMQRTLDFVPVENSHSVSSTQFYGGTIATSSRSLGQGSFTALLSDGITDNLVANKDQILTIKFFQDRNKTPFVLTQGVIGLARTYPVSDQVQADVTISSDTLSAEFIS